MNEQKLGSYPFSTYEKLEFITTGVETNEVLTFNNAVGVLTSESFRFK
jgi:hypothetical protein